jgi:FdhD protein
MTSTKLKLESIKQFEIKKVNGNAISSFIDVVSIEEPLEIIIVYGALNERKRKNISVTMRTPGNDVELALGFLFTEGIISSYQQIKSTKCSDDDLKNSIEVELQEDFVPHLLQADRNFYTTSSCGVCGKGSIQAIKTVSPFASLSNPALELSIETLYNIPQKMKSAQDDFSATGSIHASGLFDINGNLIILREDVGRHNALDKVIGASLVQNHLPLSKHILLLSGRASFELIQKAAMAGVTFVAAIGAPSSLAVELARELRITLVGFLKENRLNVYHINKQHSIKDIV